MKTPDQRTHRQRPYEEVISILDSLPEYVLKTLGFPTGSHPRNMIMKGILVPPVIARPPIYEGGAIHHDQLTHMYVTIVRKVANIASGKPDAVIELYTAVKQLIFKTEGKKMSMRDFLSIVERIQGKNALLRGLLMGKRNNYCGRTVAGPDPSLRYGQVRLPESWAKVLTKPDKVTYFNIHNLQALLEAGQITHITPVRTGLRKFYDPRFKYRLQIGDKVERWLRDGDRVVVNRQPTLHRQSMMSYEVVLGYQLTIGLHLSYTSPMNCDFDGDENNAWSPQDFEVEAEAEIILDVKQNIMSSEQNRPIMGLVMNSISGAYLLTESTTRIDDDLFAELIGLITNQDVLQSLYARLTKYGVHPR
jgi:DNA-directed RNA polymerase beta' subunit